MNIINQFIIKHYSMIIEDNILNESFSSNFNTFYQFINSYIYIIELNSLITLNQLLF